MSLIIEQAAYLISRGTSQESNKNPEPIRYCDPILLFARNSSCGKN